MTGVVTQRPPMQPLVPSGGAELLARDMTAIFSVELTLREVQEKLAPVSQWLPIDGNPDATLRTLIEQNSSGPLRVGYGAWRDLLLGAQFTNGRGELISAGGRTVKNVAGYDLTKFTIGQPGIFGTLVTITTRTYRLPDGALHVSHDPDPQILAAILPTPLKPQWAMLIAGRLTCGYLSDETTLAWYEQAVRAQSGTREIERRSLQDDIDLRTRLWQPGSGRVAFRASVPPAKLSVFAAMIHSISWIADPAFGIVIGSFDNEATRDVLRDSANSVGGSVRFGDGETLEVSTTPAERQIIERLKAAFDPDNRLAPLPWRRT